MRVLLNRSGYWERRAARHVLLALAAVCLTAVAFWLIPPPDFRHRMSMGSAYSALAFVAASLLLGAWNVLRSSANPVSFDLRRDVGIWAGLLALFHTGFGLTVHLRGRMWMYFFRKLHPLALQNTKFGFANYTGLAAGALFLLLLIISNDVSLRRLGTSRWKNLQRMSYAAAVLTVAHGVAFQLIEKRHAPWLVVFWGMVGIAAMAQLAGFCVVRAELRRRELNAARPAR